MANQVTVSNNNTINVTVEPPANVQVQVSRAVIGTVANVASANLANYVIQNSQPNITSVGTLTGLTSSGNIIAPFFIGNVVGNISGNFVVPGTNTAVLFNQQGNAGASDALKFDYAANILTANGNIVANYYSGNGSQLTGVIAVSANYANFANVSNIANSVAVSNVSGIGNIATINLDGNAGNILYGNGIFAAAPNVANIANANYANFAGDVVNSSQPNITSLGTLTGLVVGGDITPNSNVTHSLGNNTNRFNDLYLAGNTIYLGAQEISADANGISFTGNLSGNATGLSNIPGANVTGQVPYAAIANSVAGANVNGQVNYAAIANSVAGANVSGTVANATYATSAGSSASANSVAGANVSGEVNFAAVANSVAGANVGGQVSYAAVANSVALSNVSGIGNIASINLDGNVSNLLTGSGTFVAIPTGGGNAANANYANFAGNVVNSSQPNITSVGTLTSLAVTGNVSANAYQLTTSPGTLTPVTGQMVWDAAQQTVSLGMNNGVIQQVGLENYVLIKASATITDGQVVMFTGANGDNVTGAPANTASAGFRPEYIIGVATQNIANNDTGYITVFGTVNGLNTNAYNVGDILWVDNTTPGGLTATRPSDPNFQIEVAAVTKKAGGDGHILVRVSPFDKLDNLTDVTITTPSNGQALVYSGNIWVNGNPNIANIANTVSDNAQPNITSLGNLPYLQVSNSANIDGVIQQFASNNITYASNFSNVGTYQLTTQYHPNNSTGYPADRTIRSRGNVTTPTTAVSGDRIYQKVGLVYNGNTNVATFTETVTAVGTVNANANAAWTGGQYTIGTGNPSGDTGNTNAGSPTNILTFTNSGALQITPGTPANVSLGQVQSPILITNYGTSTTDLINAGGINQQRARGNRDTQTSVEPGDTIGRSIYIGHNGTAYQANQLSQYRAVVDSSYTSGDTIIPQNHQIQVVANVGGVATFKTTTFYGNGLVNLPDGLEVTTTANTSNLNVTGLTDLGNVGNVKITGGTANYVLSTDGSGNLDWVAQSGGGGTPGGNTTELQYNNAGTFGGMPNVTFDGSNISLGDISTVKIAGGTANDFIQTDGAGNLSFAGIATNLIVGTRISPVTILISNYQMNVLSRTGNVVVYVN